MDIEAALDAASALGIAILAVPVFSLNFRKKSYTRIADVLNRRKEMGAESALDDIGRTLRMDRELDAARWRPIDEICLYVGYALLLGASVLRVFF